MPHFAKRTVSACIVLLTCIAGGACVPKAKPTTVEMPDGQRIVSRQLRVWIYELTNRLSGRVEMVADEVIAKDEDPAVRRAMLEWKANVIPALQRASFEPDPLVALADIWLFVIQLGNLMNTEDGRKIAGSHHPLVVETVSDMEGYILEFIRTQGGDPDERGAYDTMHAYAADHPIEASISTRPTIAPAFVDRLRTGNVGAFAAIGSLTEGFADLSDRLSIYGEQLPKQARWQAEILLWDKGIESIDVDALLADTARLGRAADHLVDFTDQVPQMIDDRIDVVIPRIEELIESVDIQSVEGRVDAMIAAHLDVALDAVTRERAAAIEAVHDERVDALNDAERIANDIVDRSFERAETMIDDALGRLMPMGAVLMAGTFVLGLVAGLLLRRRSVGG